MPALPDEVVLMVFAYMETEELLRVRSVCSRWRDLALHEDAWVARSLDLDVVPYGLYLAVLRLAPCLYSLSLHYSLSISLAAVTTRCAVRRLDLGNVNVADAELAALVVRHQGGLGRLRCINVERCSANPKRPRGFLALLRAICSTEGLVELRFIKIHKLNSDLHPVDRGILRDIHVEPSIKVLHLPTGCPDEYKEFWLKTHATTLEGISVSPWKTSHLRASPLLVDLPNLRELAAPLEEVMVARCVHPLQTLTLFVTPEELSANVLRQVVLFFVRSQLLTNLKGVCFLVTTSKPVDDELLGLDMVAALLEGMTHRLDCGVETVSLYRRDPKPCEIFLPAKFGVFLSRLYLRAISVGGELTAEFLRTLNGHSLTELQGAFPPGCVHAWLHQPEVSAALRRNPQLRLRLSPRLLGGSRGLCEDQQTCEACHLGCHRKIRELAAARRMTADILISSMDFL